MSLKPGATGLLDLLRASQERHAAPGDGRPKLAGVARPHTGEVSAWAQKALEDEGALVASTDEGARNDRLFHAAMRMGGLVAGGELPEPYVVDILTDAGRACGLDHWEVERTILGGMALGVERPRNAPEADPDGDPLAGAVIQDAPPIAPRARLRLVEDDESFWTARPELEHVRAFARGRLTSPWAVLGCVLARAVAAVPPFVVLPALVGGYGSLNLFVGLVGPSGSGKGAAEAAARDALDAAPVERFPLGSGEGLARLFVHRERRPKGEDGEEMSGGRYDLVQDRTALVLSVPEVDSLAALGGRQGATLLPQLRQAWSGEDLGFSYSDPEKALIVRQGTYRLSLVAGIQPGRAGGLLDDSDGGTPQRFVWLPVTDAGAPDETPEAPDPMPWAAPAPWTADVAGRTVMRVPQVARDAIRAAHLARTRGEADALDGHALLARLKVAAAFAVLARRTGIDDDDWHLAGTVMAVSDRTRGEVVEHLGREQARRNEARGRAEGARELAADEVKDEAGVRRAGSAIRRALAKAGAEGATRKPLRVSLASRDRGHFDTALQALLAAGVVEAEERPGQALAYRLTGPS